MADIPFQIGSYFPRRPQFSPEPGALVYSYQNGSQVFIGAPQYVCTWNFATDDEVALVWDVYNTLVTGGSPGVLTGNYVDVTVPDFVNGGLRLTTAYMTRPTGKAVGDGTQNLSVTLYNLHASSMADAIAAPFCNYWDLINERNMSHDPYTGSFDDVNNKSRLPAMGTSEYPGTGWQY